MKEQRNQIIVRVLVCVVAHVAFVSSATALDGANSPQTTGVNGWKTFELITNGNNISALTESAAGYGTTMTRHSFDGLGATLSGDTLSVFVNHEQDPNASISRVNADLVNLKQKIQRTIDNGITPAPPSIVSGVGLAYTSIYTGLTPALAASGYTGGSSVVAYGNANFRRFCSGTMYEANSFGAGRGFTDAMYITGEEVTGGLFYAIDPATRSMWEVGAFGAGSWENAALLDTGNTTHVAVALQSDIGSGSGDFIRLYVGKKNVDVNGDSTVDFLERNGLRGGSIYFFEPDSGMGFDPNNLPTTVPYTGKWTATATAGVDLRDTKLEDIHANPANGEEAVFSDQTDGIYKLSIDLQFTGDSLNSALSTGTIARILSNVSSVDAPDNLVWSPDGRIYVQEDGGGFDTWRLNPDGSGLWQIGDSAVEPSGILDISSLVGYRAGSIFLASALSGGASSQLLVMVSPDAVQIPEPATLVVVVPAALWLLGTRRRRDRVR